MVADEQNIDSRVATAETKIEILYKDKIPNIERKLDHIETKITNVDKKVDKLHAQVDTLNSFLLRFYSDNIQGSGEKEQNNNIWTSLSLKIGVGGSIVIMTITLIGRLLGAW